ncbi:MMPL family transporter [Micromonospora sp. AKA38]|uniref:MMPL family transporter n=1 Tax=Micromonospora sp. AKA38 TaxID=2733861 RepID=UPI002490E363|nr:MMPL family transporter [Micromonospora sp. AKA38]
MSIQTGDVRKPFAERVASWSVRHRWPVLVGWLVLVVATVLGSSLISGNGAPAHDPGESGVAQQALRDQPEYLPIRENVLISPSGPGSSGFASDPEARAAAADVVDELREMPSAVSDVRSPLDPAAPGQVSADGRSGLVTFVVAGPDDAMLDNYQKATDAVSAVAATHTGVRIDQAGDRSLSATVDDAIKKDFKTAETTSLPLTILILLVVFGSLIAAGIPLLLAATTVAAAMSVLSVVDLVVPINSATSSMILLIGVAVSVDYSLFYLRREREERAAGRETGAALEIAARTSGRVVVISGLTVMLCVGGLWMTGLDNFRGLTMGTITVVGLAVIGSVTALPALLAILGHRVDRARVPWLGRRRTVARESRFWTAVARNVVRRPLLWGTVAVLVLVGLMVPALDMRLQDAGPTNSLPRSVPAVDGAVRMQAAFPGAAAPEQVVVWGADAASPQMTAATDELRRRIGASGGLLHEPVSVMRVGEALVVRVPLDGNGTDQRSNQALRELRQEVLPATFGKVPGAKFAVAGKTAFAYDFTQQVRQRMIYVFAFVLLLAFVLLSLAFRSWWLPVASIVLNLLSIGAAYGVLTWVFQDGHLSGLLGFTAYGGITDWLPLFIFVLLFGLSMDYHIFILSRVRERRAAGADVRTATVGGVGASAGVVTSAAAIMIGVFSVFVTLSAIEYKMLGVGMAVAILIDATVVRGVLLPAALALLGDRAWSRRSLSRERELKTDQAEPEVYAHAH